MGLYDKNPGQRQGGGIGGRIIVGIIIALIAWFTYANHTEENPVTGQKQHVTITPDQEIRLGLESAPQMSREMGGELPANDPRSQEVIKMGSYLVSQTIAKKSPWKFQFHLLADPETVNAFALPGGQIFITLGLLNKLETEAQLAGVLSHEMGHVIERHTAEQMAKNQLGQALVIAVGAAASQDGSSSSPYMIAAMVNQMMQLRYGRQDELEADEWGLKLMSQAGFDPTAMIKVMEILKAASAKSGGTLDIFQTHPNPDLRIQQIQDYLEKNPPASGLSQGGSLKRILGR